MCCGFVDFCRAHDTPTRTQALAYAALDSPLGGVLAERFRLPQPPESFVLVEDGVAYTRSDAALFTLSRLRPRAAWTAMMLFHPVPRLLRDRVYDLGWRCRRQLFGTRSCYQVPDECAARASMLQGAESPRS